MMLVKDGFSTHAVYCLVQRETDPAPCVSNFPTMTLRQKGDSVKGILSYVSLWIMK